jgi:hypothetical protein
MTTRSFQPTPPKVRELFGSPSALGAFPGVKTDTAYDAKWAYALAVSTGWAYADGQIFADQIQYYGFPGCKVTEIAVSSPALLIVATGYFVRSQDGRVGCLVFRGTLPTVLLNWLTDFNSAKYPFGGGYVHSGFFSNIEALWGEVVDVVDEALQSGLQELYIAGHSLGAAMAVLAAARIHLPQPPGAYCYDLWKKALRGVYTYGQPMVGDEGFKSTFEPKFGALLYRHVYAHDAVPCVPPVEVDATFQHFGAKYLAVSREDSWAGPPAPPALDALPDRRATLEGLAFIAVSFITQRVDALAALNVPYSLDDHSPSGYIDVSSNSLHPAAPRVKKMKSRAATLAARIVGGIGALVSREK